MYVKIIHKITLLLTIVILVGVLVSDIERVVVHNMAGGLQNTTDEKSTVNTASTTSTTSATSTTTENEAITSYQETTEKVPDDMTSGGNDSMENTTTALEMNYVFVYGTLMKGMRNHAYLKTSIYIGDGQIEGYEMYDLGTYPGIIAGVGTVPGEVYQVTLEVEKRLDRLENEGVLYLKKLVEVRLDDGETIVAKVYIYNRSVAGKVKLEGKYSPAKPTTKPTTEPTTESTTVEEPTAEATTEQEETTTEENTEVATTEAVTTNTGRE